MGYAVRPLRRAGAHKPVRRAPRHRSYWVPNGGSLQYVIVGDGTMLLSGDAVILASGATTAGGGDVRAMSRRDVRVL